MFSENEIVETFKTMGLFSLEERERFHTMLAAQVGSGQEQTYVFIRASGGSIKLESEEVGDAELEANS